MNDLNVYRVAQIGGALLAGAMLVLLGIGTYSMATFVTWAVFFFVGAGIFYGARKLDEDHRDKRPQ